MIDLRVGSEYDPFPSSSIPKASLSNISSSSKQNWHAPHYMASSQQHRSYHWTMETLGITAQLRECQTLDENLTITDQNEPWRSGDSDNGPSWNTSVASIHLHTSSPLTPCRVCNDRRTPVFTRASYSMNLQQASTLSSIRLSCYPSQQPVASKGRVGFTVPGLKRRASYLLD